MKEVIIISNKILDRIIQAKENIDDDIAIEKVVNYLKLDNYNPASKSASCPFGHSDSTPSFKWDKKQKMFHCFSGETKVITFNGIREMKDLINFPVKILNGNEEWEEVAFKKYGVQDLVRLHLVPLNLFNNGCKEKYIYTTAYHEWILTGSKKKVYTNNLKHGDVIGFSNVNSPIYIVDKVEKTDRHEDVYCCETSTKSFYLEGMVLTGNCFSCGKNFSLLDLYIRTEGSYRRAVEKLCNEAGIPFNSKDLKIEDKSEFFLNYIYPEEVECKNRTVVENYCAKRGISVNTLDYAGIKQDYHGNVVFELRDLDDTLLAIKYRLSRAVKNKDEPKMWWDKKASNCPILYNINRIDTSQPLIIVEGYFDALALIESGNTNVVSIPGGAQDLKWIQFNYEFLENFNTIYLWFDNDKAGQDGLENTINRIGESKIKVIKPTVEDEDEVEKYYKNISNTDISIRKTDANNILLACGAKRISELITFAEEIPCKNLKYLMDCEVVNVMDIPKTSTGIGELDDILYGNLYPCFTIYSGVAGCVDADTEYFNGKEWKRIAEYQSGERVLQYDIKNNIAELAYPLEYIKKPCNTLYRIGGHKGIRMTLSPEHNVLWYDKNNVPHKSQFSSIMNEHNKKVYGFEGKIRGCFEYSGNGIDLSDAEIELMCAIICDGSFYYNSVSKDLSHRESYNTARFHIKKDRKKVKLREIFNKCGLEYRETESKSKGYTDFYVKAPRREKEFTEYWYNCTNHQLQIICDNILFWDGYIGKSSKEFSTTSKKTADFIQFAFTSCNTIATIQTLNRVGKERKSNINGKKYSYKNIEYCVTINSKQYYGVGGSTYTKTKSDIEEVTTKDGYKYCFTMPKGTLILRTGNRIFTTFNSGKSSLTNTTCVLPAIENNEKIFIFSGELGEGQLLDWIITPCAGLNHILEMENKNINKPFYVVSTEAMSAIKRFYRRNIILYDSTNSLDTSGESILREMETAYRRFGCTVFLIDNLMCISFDGEESESKWDSQKKFITKLMGFTNKYGVNVNLVLHPRKPSQAQQAGTQSFSVYDLHGASEIGNLCHRLLWISRLNDQDKQLRIDVVKDRPSQSAGQHCELYYDKRTRRIYGTEEERTKTYKWEQSSNIIYTQKQKELLLCNRPDDRIITSGIQMAIDDNQM